MRSAPIRSTIGFLSSASLSARARILSRTHHSGNPFPRGSGWKSCFAIFALLTSEVLAVGGAGLVSTARDFARFGAMYLGAGALGRVRIMKPETPRRARSNLLPAGVVYPNGGGFGAGARIVLSGSDHRFGPPGSFGWGGAAGTDWWIDPARQGNMVFMTQFMPPPSYNLRNDITAAVEADLDQGK